MTNEYMDPRKQLPITDNDLMQRYIANGWDWNIAIALVRRANEEWPEQVTITSKVTKKVA